MGGNGFMQVSATHAALKLAQGAGRLVRSGEDRGVVAFLDSRMMSARYAGFLQKSLPPFWPTSDRQMVLGALQRLDQTAPAPLPVAEPVLRGLGGSGAGAGASQAAAGAAAPVADPPPVARSARTAVTGGHAWSEEQDQELRDAVEAGVDLTELAEHLQLPPDAITARLNQLGLELTADGMLEL